MTPPIDLDQAKKLEKEAEKNEGHCSHCGQTIKIYRYGISTSMVNVLKAMGRASTRGGAIIDVDKLDLRHSERTQLTKLRFHGLVAKVKEDGHQIPRHWVITTKGWQFIAGNEIQAKVVVYNNQVLGHDGGMTTIKRVGGLAGDFEQQPVTEAESRQYSDVRTPQRHTTINAVYVGPNRQNLGKNDFTLTLEVERLQIGHPVKLTVVDTGDQLEYRDIAAFKRDWRVTA